MTTSENGSGNVEIPEENAEVRETDEVQTVEILPGYSKFDDYAKAGFDAMRAGIKAANGLPSGENFNYYACFSVFNDIRNDETKKLLNSMQRILNLAGVGGNIERRDMDEKFELLQDANDVFLDRAGVRMDEEAGVSRNPGIELIVSQARSLNVNGSWNTTTTTSSSDMTSEDSSNDARAIRLLAAKNVRRPQLTFKDKIDNSAKPWLPRIKDKPNALKPLAIFLEESDGGEIASHPYEFELDKFEPPDGQLRKSPPVEYKPLEDTPLIVIEKPRDIEILLDDLRKYDEIAVDLEHHSYRSFQGITCLMQISTRDTDYLIDTLTLRSELHELNEIFTKPTILKVFHGAESDILWLQRDLSLYVVNMFDTHKAAKHLGYPFLSLAYLMKRYCNVNPNKHFQLADWRIRPLPEELMKYAREDTHYLLYIKDLLRNELIEAANGRCNVLKAVYSRSTDLCKQTYTKPVWTEDSYSSMYRKSQKMFDDRQLYALKELHRWRDAIARQEDDSTGYVLPNHMMLNIAETLPREMQGILACCNPIPPLLRQNLLKLHKIILKAREQPLIKPVLEEDTRQRMTRRNQAASSEMWFYRPHDIPSGMEPRADLPCLLDTERNVVEAPLPDERVPHRIVIFDSPPVSEDEDSVESSATSKGRKSMFVSPFERYKRVLPMVAQREAEERARLEKEEEERLRKIDEEKKKTDESINRVYEHFKVITGAIKRDVDPSSRLKEAPAATPVSLGQMHGRKRKRDSSTTNVETPRKMSVHDTLTPESSPDTRAAVRGTSGKNQIVEDWEKGSEMQKSINGKRTSLETPNSGRLEAIRAVTRREKKANKQSLREKGMLPTETFDYKAVDFSTFQGGSTSGDIPKPTMLKEQKKKNKNKRGKRGKRGKQKLSCG